MSTLDQTIQNLVIANRILAYEGVVDAYGHVSVRSLNFATWIRDDGQLKIGMPDICND